MKAVWRRYPATVKDVQTAIRPRRPLAYTTVMTMLTRMEHKGFLHRARRSRAYIYAPAVEFSDVRDAAVAKVVSQFFDGSKESLTRFLSSEADDLSNVLRFEPDHGTKAAAPSPAHSLDETLL
jgi:predicted transcriptional regulator